MYTVANETQECVASIHVRISIQYDVGPQYIATPQHHITANVAYCAMYIWASHFKLASARPVKYEVNTTYLLLHPVVNRIMYRIKGLPFTSLYMKYVAKMGIGASLQGHLRYII